MNGERINLYEMGEKIMIAKKIGRGLREAFLKSLEKLQANHQLRKKRETNFYSRLSNLTSLSEKEKEFNAINEPNEFEDDFQGIFEQALSLIEKESVRNVFTNLVKVMEKQKTERNCVQRYLNFIDSFIQTKIPKQHEPFIETNIQRFVSDTKLQVLESECFAIGMNDDNQLGMGSKVRFLPFTSKFRKVDFENSASTIRIREIASGSLFTVATTYQGQLFSWGLSELLGREGPEDTPGVVEFPQKSTRILSVAAGEYLTACIDCNNIVYTFGGFRDSKSNIIGYSKFPNRVVFPDPETTIVKVACGESHLLLLASDGSVFSMGAGEYGQMGRPKCVTMTPKIIHFAPTVINIFACGFSSFFLTKEGNVFACGNNGFGELGLGHCQSVLFPSQIMYFAQNNIKIQMIAGGMHHTLFLTLEGTIFGSGKNNDGQLGIPGFDFVIKHPIECQTLEKFRFVSAGTSSHHSYAISTQGNLYTTGQNEYRQLSVDKDTLYEFTRVNLKERKCLDVHGGCQFTVVKLTIKA